ncbi:unnamed protein product [Lasius platythorax]|uniref:Uncharacterized protein n=1 Tax=Lasius platythorax TaxID=488582 RepID=A0AAV2P2D6_9HYME
MMTIMTNVFELQDNSVKTHSVERLTVFGGKQQHAIGGLSERESMRNASVYETAERSIVRIMVDLPYGRMVGTVICMCAQLMSGPGPSSLV